jgi:hypothetical protein
MPEKSDDETRAAAMTAAGAAQSCVAGKKYITHGTQAVRARSPFRRDGWWIADGLRGARSGVGSLPLGREAWTVMHDV